MVAIPVRIRAELFALTQCQDCKLCGGNRPRRPVFGNGSRDARLVVVGEAPGKAEVDHGEPFVGASGRLLWETLSQIRVPGEPAGISRSEVYATNALLCPVREDEAVTVKDIRACRPRLIAELKTLHPKVILCVGAKAAETVRGEKVRMGDYSGRVEWSDEWRAYIAYAYHPAAVLYDPTVYQDFLWGLKMAVGALGRPPRQRSRVVPITYDMCDTVESVLAMCALAHRQPVVVCDIETTGLDPYRDDILEVGFCWESDHSYIVPAALLPDPMASEALVDLFGDRDVQWVGHNFKFDVEFLRVLDFPARVDGDSMLLHFCLDERSGGEMTGGKHDLKFLSRKYSMAPTYADEIDSAHMLKVPPDKRHVYQAHDLAYTFRLYHKLRSLLAKEPPSRKGYPMPLAVHDRFLVPLSNAIVNIELRGIRIDTSRMRTLFDEYAVQIEAARGRAVTAAGDVPTTFNPNSSVQVGKVLYSPRGQGGMNYPPLGKKRTSTDEETIHALQRHDVELEKSPNPFLDAVLEYRSLIHTRSTYLEGIQNRLVYGRGNRERLNLGKNSRLSTSLLIHGTTSGRLSSRDPNLQNLPKDSSIKQMFIPREGRVMLEADYRRLEVGVLAWYSRDPQLIIDFAAEDFHWTVALSVFERIVERLLGAQETHDLAEMDRLCREQVMFSDFALRQSGPSRSDNPDEIFGWLKERLRRQSKYITFGIMYGEGSASLAKVEKGLGVPVRQAAQYKAKWQATYPVATAFMTEQARLAQTQRWVESASGHRRRFNYPDNLEASLVTEAMNHPIQSFAAYICEKAMIQLDEQLPANDYGDVLMTVHDAILTDLRIDRLESSKALIREVMRGIVIDPEIVFEVDMKVGPNWGALH